ncbi:MAG: prepilin-type N-terminal cleavage/methylation domain-containing protein [Candidatus Neomarinimicrobiota bacterium]
MNFLKSNRGFTLTELSIALVISSIIALTASVIVVSASNNFNRGSRQIRLQRDVSFANDLLTNSIREASGGTVVIYSDSSETQVVNPGECLKIGTSALYYKSSRDLVYKSGSGQPQHLIRNSIDTLCFFYPTAADSQNCLGFRIALQEDGCSVATTGNVYFRN